MRVFDCVAQQIDEYTLYPDIIAVKAVGKIVAYVQIK